MGVFDNDLENYLNRLDREEPEDETLTCDLHHKSNCCESPFYDETLVCDLHHKSNCCESHFYDETDVCMECLEHASEVCNDCPLFDECNNDNKPLIQL